MKKSELNQLKGLSIKELVDKAKSLRKEIADLVIDKNMKKLKDTKLVFKKRKELAQVLTVLRQKQLLEELESKIKKPDELEVEKVERRKAKDNTKKRGVK